MEVFTQFASDLDDETKKQLKYGQGLMRMLRQEQYRPYSEVDMVIALSAALSHGIDNIDTDEINDFIYSVIDGMHSAHPDICSRIGNMHDLSDEDRQAIVSYTKEANRKWLIQNQSSTE